MTLMFLNGTAMSGQADHHTIEGAIFIGAARTAARYRFIAVGGRFPGLLPVGQGGAAIVGELYDISEATLVDRLLPTEPPELAIGTIELSDGQSVSAMLLQPERLLDGDEFVDITGLGGWRAYRQHLADNRTLAALLGRDRKHPGAVA